MITHESHELKKKVRVINTSDNDCDIMLFLVNILDLNKAFSILSIVPGLSEDFILVYNYIKPPLVWKIDYKSE